MAFKALLALSASVLLAQSALGQCLGRGGSYGAGLSGVNLGGCAAGLGGYGAGLGGYGAGLGGCGHNSGVASTGGGLAVSSSSPVAPVGVTVLSENTYEGQLTAGGNLPFLGSVGIEGAVPSAGAGAVSYGCGDGAVAIGSEGPVTTGITIPGAIFPPSSPNSAATADALALVGNGAGLAGYGLGAGYGIGNAAGYGIGNAAGYGIGAGYGRGCGCGAVY